MNRSIFFQYVLSASFLLSLSINSHAQYFAAPQLVSGGTRCDHVIQMMLRHGVNNSFNRSATSSLLNQSPFGSLQVPVAELGDLQIVQVNQLPLEVPACGPKFAVMVMNQSSREVCGFHVSAVTVFGHITPISPNATVEVAKINPGEAIEVIIALPIEAFSMGNRNGEVLGFQKLVVAIDSYDELLETDEANNIKAFDVNELTVVATVVSQAATAVIESSIAAPTAQVIAPVSVRGPVQNPVNNVSGDVSVDAPDLEQPTPDSLRSAIQQVSTPQPAPTQVAPTQPVPSQPLPTQPAPSQPVPSQPTNGNVH